jgi:hypothetical protein
MFSCVIMLVPAARPESQGGQQGEWAREDELLSMKELGRQEVEAERG